MLLYSILFALCSFHLYAQSAGSIKAGPMVTHADMRQVTIWLQMSNPCDVRIQYAPIDAPTAKKQSITYKADASNGYRLHIVLDSVEPGKRYSYAVNVNGQKIQIAYPLEFSIPPLWQWRSDPPSFTVALGSCFYVNEVQYDRPGKPYGNDLGIISGILAKKPDLMIWLGDNVYLREADWTSRIGIFRRYEHTRSIPELQP
ncbi:MAG: alkaline phosphatase family protein, partial [Ignavibacteria bacterium]